VKRALSAILLLLATAVAAETAVQGTQKANKHMGVATCASTLCHGSAQPLDSRNVLQNEYVTWSHFDPHARAYRVLLEPRSRAIAKRLGLKDAHTAKECLDCHTSNVPAAQRGARFQLSDGVGCESCHGAAEPWLATHHGGSGASHANNLAAGLVSAERPAVLAEVCMGCHVGDSSRLATHRMMAAGHPRLTFELDTYTEIWRTSGGREHFRRDADYGLRKGRVASLEVWLTGLTATTQRSIALVAGHTNKRSVLPEFAIYNCYSCHRSMRVTGWGGAEESDAAPGSLRLQDASSRVLLALASSFQVSGAAALRRDLATLQAAANASPDRTSAAAAQAQRSLAAVAANLARIDTNRVREEQALAALAAAARRGQFSDYAAAEQAAMGMALLLAELDLDRQQRPEIDRLFDALAKDDAFDARRFERALQLLGPTRQAN
jgi:hypothetical protein